MILANWKGRIFHLYLIVDCSERILMFYAFDWVEVEMLSFRYSVDLWYTNNMVHIIQYDAADESWSLISCDSSKFIKRLSG